MDTTTRVLLLVEVDEGEEFATLDADDRERAHGETADGLASVDAEAALSGVLWGGNVVSVLDYELVEGRGKRSIRALRRAWRR